MFDQLDELVGEYAELETRLADPAIHADVCAACHPFYTGKQKILDTGGRVARFEQRYAKKDGAKKTAEGKDSK